MYKVLSVLRRVNFIIMIILMVIQKYNFEYHKYFVISVISFLVILFFSYVYYYFLYKKYPNMKSPFISTLWRADICNPIIEHSRKYYQKGARLGALWDKRNSKERSFKEKVKSLIVRIIVYCLILVTIYAVVSIFI